MRTRKNMNKLMKICTPAVFVILAVCAQTAALDPDELITIRESADKALNAHDLDTVMSYWAKDCVYDYMPLPNPFEGKKAIRGFFEALFVGFPDFGTTEGRVFAADNIVVVEHSTTGTHLGEWMGIPPSGDTSPTPHIDIFEFNDDKIERVTTYLDAASVMIQLGVIPAPEMPELIPSFTLPDSEPTCLVPLEANTEAIARWNSHNMPHYAKMLHPNFEVFAGPVGITLDRNAWVAMSELYFQIFSGTHIEIVREVDMGNGWILTEEVSSGVQDGPFFGVRPTGRKVAVRAVLLSHYDADGLLTHMSYYFDNITLMTQMTAKDQSPVGTWIVTAPTPMGDITMLHMIHAQDASGKRYGGMLKDTNPDPTLFGTFPQANVGADLWASQTVRTGPDSFESTLLYYSSKKAEGPVPETVFIAIVNATWRLTGPNTNEGEATLAAYLAEQDVDGDGFPDEGQEPAVCMGFTYTSRRLTMMPGCVPPPIPEQN